VSRDWGLRDYGESVVSVWGGSPNCAHKWTEKIIHQDNLRFRDPHGKSGVGGHREELKTNPKVTQGFCSKCGAWRGQLGLEPHPSLFIEHMVEVCRSVKRVLKKGGSMYLNLGDTYCSNWGAGRKTSWMSPKGEEEGKGTHELDTPISANWARKIAKNKTEKNWLQPKQKLLMPHRVAIALQDDGWVCRNDIVWAKPNAMPSSVKDRLNVTHEYVFHFVQARRYFYDLDAIREPHKQETLKWNQQHNVIGKKGYIPKKSIGLKTILNNKREGYQAGWTDYHRNPKGKNPGDVIKTPYAVQPRQKLYVEKRDLPPLETVKNYLNMWRKKCGFTIDQVEQLLKSQAPHHWFNGESYPTKEDWWRIKQLLQFDDELDEQMTVVSLKPAEKQDHPKGKNPGDFWSITTRPFKGAHFAVYPLELCRKPILSSCPEWVCTQCGKTRERITKTKLIRGSWGKQKKMIKNYPTEGRMGDSIHETVGWTDCGCNVGFNAGVVLDPMCGSGSTLVMAQRLGRQWLGIELNQEYVEIAKKRLRGESRKLTEW
jgi:DNA modification methylase